VTIAPDLPALAALLPPYGSLLALDVSKRRIGLAGTDPGRRLVTPLHTLPRSRWKDDWPKLAKVAAEREAVALVVGSPSHMDGSGTPEGEAARAFAANLHAALGLPAYLQDERLTTFVVEDMIEEGRLPRPKRPGDPVDHYAAAVILEDCLAGLARLAAA
jgi:putative Holliday junction resolvase